MAPTLRSDLAAFRPLPSNRFQRRNALAGAVSSCSLNAAQSSMASFGWVRTLWIWTRMLFSMLRRGSIQQSPGLRPRIARPNTAGPTVEAGSRAQNDSDARLGTRRRISSPHFRDRNSLTAPLLVVCIEADPACLSMIEA